MKVKSELSPADFVAAVSATALVVSATFYWGFFYKFGPSFLSTLSTQDLLVGALIAVVPSIIAGYVGVLINTVSGPPKATSEKKDETSWSRLHPLEKFIVPLWFARLPSHLVQKQKGWLANLILITGSVFCAWKIFYGLNGDSSDQAILFLSIAVMIGWISVASAYEVGRWTVLAMVFGALVITVYVLGAVTYERAARKAILDPTDSITLRDGSVRSGGILLRTTKGVLFVEDGKTSFIQSEIIGIVSRTNMFAEGTNG